MGEIKSVKVDNWGVFFLQKLQNFFNKTDYCDLTLQFRDNSQLKVHRLVLSACTDYFNVLEQTCEVVDDALIMPNELQADVVVPIVNFMYTGTLEFELKMYGKLLRTAKEMNMTVLLKLLEAHRRTMENVNRAQRPPSPKAIRRRIPAGIQTIPANAQFQNQAQQTRRTDVAGTAVVQRRIIQTKTAGTNVSPALQVYRQQIGSTSVVRTSALKANQPTIQSYIKNEPEEYETIATTQPTSPFEQLRKGYNNNKRPAVTTFTSPPTKKPNLEDVKEFAEQQRMRKQIAAEYGDDQEFEGMMDDDIHNDDDDDDAAVNAPAHSSSIASNAQTTEGTRSTSITFKQESDGQPPTIIVKDSSGSKLNHAKIISEVLRQYPHLAKGNKNIKLKILPNSSGQTQRIVVKKEAEQPQTQQTITKPVVQQKTILPTQLLPSQVTIKAGDRVVAAAKATLPSPTVATPSATAETVDNSQQKRRIDSKTMRALIALGAENMTGPWLCLRCGVNGRPISIPSYRGFRRHLINTHKETIDPALCEHCGWRSRSNRELHFHIQIEHKIKTTLYTFPECLLCMELFLDTNALNQHMLDSHPSANKQQCIYCNKIFIKEMQLYTHMKLYHKHQAIEDGIIDASDDELGGLHGEEGDEGEQLDSESEHEHEEEMTKSSTQPKDTKVKIISDISLPMASSISKLENDSVKAPNIALGPQTKFVTADGNEMMLTEEQRKEIMSQLNQDHNNGGVVMVLQETIFPSGETIGSETAASSAEETTSARGDVVSEEELDDSQIYAELGSARNTNSQDKTEKVEMQGDGKEALDDLAWAENLISEHDLEDAGNDAETKKDDENKTKKDDISQKLKELTGDWSEDENEEEDINNDLDKTKKPEIETTDKTGDAIKDKSTTDQTEEFPSEAEKEAVDSADGKSSSSKKEMDVDKQEEAVVEEAVVKDAVETETETETESKNESKKTEEDDLDLAMQNLHEGEAIKTEKDLSSEDVKSFGEDIKVDIDEVKKEVEMAQSVLVETNGSNVEKSATSTSTTIVNAASEAVDHSTALLDELMSTTTTGDVNLDAQKQKVIDDFEDAELNDVEEFTSLEKSEQQPSSDVIAKETKTSSEDETKSHEEANSATKDTSRSVNESETTVSVAKSLSSDWEDIDDDEDAE